MIGHSLGRVETCFGRDPRHQRRWDPIPKHIPNPEVAPFDVCSVFDWPPASSTRLKSVSEYLGVSGANNTAWGLVVPTTRVPAKENIRSRSL